jgi:hypothetical protein
MNEPQKVIRVTMPGTMSVSDEPAIEVVQSVQVNECECAAFRAELQTRKQTQKIVARSWHQVQADNKQLPGMADAQ